MEADLGKGAERWADLVVALPNVLEESEEQARCQGRHVREERGVRRTWMLADGRRIRQWGTMGVAALAVFCHAVPAVAAESNPTAAAEELADQAYKQQAAGKYAEAIGTYVRAYELSGAGAILFNVATIYDRKLHERSLAMEYFRRYLQTADAQAAFVQKATDRLSVLRAEADPEETPSFCAGPGEAAEFRTSCPPPARCPRGLYGGEMSGSEVAVARLPAARVRARRRTGKCWLLPARAWEGRLADARRRRRLARRACEG
jgi:hypothetical protein